LLGSVVVEMLIIVEIFRNPLYFLSEVIDAAAVTAPFPVRPIVFPGT